MGFTIITAVSPEFERMETELMPTWEANSGADDIVIHRINAGQWAQNILERARCFAEELIKRQLRRERVLLLDIDCMVLRKLGSGFSPDHPIAVARWPNVNMGVAFFNLRHCPYPYTWDTLLGRVVRGIEQKIAQGHTPRHECDQVVWRPLLHGLGDKIFRLAEWEWNYNSFDLPQWRRELPVLQDIVRVLHIKGHGDYEYAALDDKLQYAKQLWPKELACIA